MGVGGHPAVSPCAVGLCSISTVSQENLFTLRVLSIATGPDLQDLVNCRVYTDCIGSDERALSNRKLCEC